MAIIIGACQRPHHRIYTVSIHGNIISVTVTATASVVKQWLRTTLFFRRSYLHNLVVGLGVQWTPGRRDTPAETLQLCVGCRCLIFQLAHADYVPMLLRRFLLSPSHTFVGFWNHSDRRKLEISDHELEMYRDPLDLRNYVETDEGESLARASTEEIIEECLEFTAVSLPREVSMSDWDDEFLSGDQVMYACVDAYCAFLIGRNYRAWQFTRVIQEVSQLSHNKVA